MPEPTTLPATLSDQTFDQQHSISDVISIIKTKIALMEEHQSLTNTVIHAFNRAEMPSHPYVNILRNAALKRNERILQLKGVLCLLE